MKILYSTEDSALFQIETNDEEADLIRMPLFLPLTVSLVCFQSIEGGLAGGGES